MCGVPSAGMRLQSLLFLLSNSSSLPLFQKVLPSPIHRDSFFFFVSDSGERGDNMRVLSTFLIRSLHRYILIVLIM